MDIEAIVNRAYTSWVYGKGTAWTDHMRSALTEMAAGYEQKIAGLESEAILSRALSDRIRQLEAERVPEGMVNLPATDHRITVDDEGVPTIMLGCGGFVISDVYSVGLDYAGVSLELRAETKEVGMSDFTNYGKSSGESGAVLKIVATRPESLLVLIGELQEAVDGFGTLPPAAPAKEEGEVVDYDDDIKKRMRFYAVNDLISLSRIQSEHIARLQKKLPTMRDEQPRNPRSGGE